MKFLTAFFVLFAFLSSLHGRIEPESLTLSAVTTGQVSGVDEEPLPSPMPAPLYRPIVSFFVHQPQVAIALALTLLAIGGVLFVQLGSEFVPRLNEGDLLVRATMAPSISLVRNCSRTRCSRYLCGKGGTTVKEIKAYIRPHELKTVAVMGDNLSKLLFAVGLPVQYTAGMLKRRIWLSE